MHNVYNTKTKFVILPNFKHIYIFYIHECSDYFMRTTTNLTGQPFDSIIFGGKYVGITNS